MSSLGGVEVELKVNRVPAAPIVAIVQDYLERQLDLSQVAGDERGTSPLLLLSMRCDLQEDTLRKIVYDNRNVSLDFDLADLLLTKMNKVDLWWGELSDMYDKAHLVDGMAQVKPGRASGVHTCPAPMCSKDVIYTGVGAPKKYCSKACASRAWYRENKLKGRYGSKYGACPRGHERSEENTQIRKDGTPCCRVCRREEAAARRADPAERARINQRQRERRQRLKQQERIAA